MKIQKVLVASKQNRFHPYLLRPFGLMLVVVTLLLVNLTYNLSTTHSYQVLGYATNISAAQIVYLTNQQRSSNGLPALNSSSQLTQAAQAKAQDMIAKNYWNHFAPDGTSPWDFINASGYSYTTAGENLAKDFDTSAGTVTGWMNSPAHRDNILNSSFRDVGIAVLDGTLLGSPTTLVVAMYGAPVASAPAPAPAAAAPAAPAAKQPISAATPPEPETSSAPTETTPVETAPAQASAASDTPAPAAPTPNTTTATSRSIDYRAVQVRESRNWAQNASLFILSFIFLASVMKHTIVWRTQRRGWRHIWLRAHPAAQYALLFVALGANLISSAGVIR